MLQEDVELLFQELVTQFFFGVLPDVVDALQVFHLVGGSLLTGLCYELIFALEEVLQGCNVDAALLAAKERLNHAQGIAAIVAKCFLLFGVGDKESQFVGLVLDELLSDKALPHHGTDLFVFLIGEVVSLALKLLLNFCYFAGVFHHLLEVLHGKRFAIYFSHLLLAYVYRGFNRLEQVASDKCEQA